ncbi:MAG: hypothetical protein J6T17_02150 [Clostridia bacterium]|nr:hypothetical protein [Clostridia bacterium]
MDELGRERRVEQIILRIAGVTDLDADLSDLAQMVYVTLLEYDPAKLARIWETDAINFLIVRLVKFNLNSKTSRYYYAIKIFSARSNDLSTVENQPSEG